MELHAVEGKLSQFYNHFEDFRFASCEATDTRLMGVVAMRITWRGLENSSAAFYQIIHLDFSEYGVDDYFEFDCTPGTEACHDNIDAMEYHWHAFTSVMGGRIVSIPLGIMLNLINSAIQLAGDDVYRQYDSEENAEFRRNALLRIGLMKETLGNTDSICADFSEIQTIAAVSPNRLTPTETINYFLMRLVDLDYPAASYLSTMSMDELQECELTNLRLQTLMRNTIKKSSQEEDPPTDGKSYPYRCSMTTLGELNYYYTTLVIFLSGDYKSRDSKVTAVRVGSMDRLSEYEAAIQLGRHEYITVFDCRDRMLGNFDGNRISYLTDVIPHQVPNGWLFTIYNKDNAHVNSSDYRMNDDVFGYALLTIDGEYVIMSNKLYNIDQMDKATLVSLYAPFMRLVGRYELATPIFQDLCSTYGIMFRELIEDPRYGD